MTTEMDLNVDYAWSSSEQCLYPLHKPELVERAVKIANIVLREIKTN